MPEQLLILAGSGIVLLLGSMHLYYTFFTNKLDARSAGTMERMQGDHPVLTRRTTMWKAWVGFNASHSIGAIFFGLINILLAIRHFDYFRTAPDLYVLDIAALAFYLFLAKRYWFRIPLTGVLIALLCFAASGVLVFCSGIPVD
ncbi:MAG: hypothetical protein H6565_08180 [Lewinellaceae bacterium]|nr:hypothetical protein [Saprospiraceae bacterium]MCB9306558.1 hypothetical protein [Lewinellaceae bacterium]MCB9355368.1 hypothetical protein [Lewinellaceae bacterium]